MLLAWRKRVRVERSRREDVAAWLQAKEENAAALATYGADCVVPSPRGPYILGVDVASAESLRFTP